MAFDVSNLYKRYNALETEVNYTQRKRREEAEAVFAALQSISDADVEMLVSDVPDLEVVRKYTVDEILLNEHGELVRLQQVYSRLTYLLDSWLKHYEDALC